MRKYLFKAIVSSVLLTGLLIVGSWQLLLRYIDSPMAIVAPQHYMLERGSSLASVARWLGNKGYVEYPQIIILYSRITGEGKHIQAGEYVFEPMLTPRRLIEKLTGGEINYYAVTFVEGSRLSQLLATIAAQSRMEHSDPALLKKHIKWLAEGYASGEGLFFPDTYYYYSGMSDLDLLSQASRRMNQILTDAWAQRADKLPYKTAYQALIMASLIEKETGVAYEREQIAGVFVRRLRKKMRLQTDPTVIYGLGESFDGNLRSRDLKDSTNIYNTYRHFGLPPSPIAMPGKEAIYAALHPAAGDSLYFVAKGDGSHYFSSTFEEHNRAVRKYQLQQRKKNYRSAPGPNVN